LLNNSQLNFRELEKCSKPSRKASRKFSPRNYQTLKMGLATTFAPLFKFADLRPVHA